MLKSEGFAVLIGDDQKVQALRRETRFVGAIHAKAERIRENNMAGGAFRPILTSLNKTKLAESGACVRAHGIAENDDYVLFIDKRRAGYWKFILVDRGKVRLVTIPTTAHVALVRAGHPTPRDEVRLERADGRFEIVYNFEVRGVPLTCRIRLGWIGAANAAPALADEVSWQA